MGELVRWANDHTLRSDVGYAGDASGTHGLAPQPNRARGGRDGGF